MGRVFKTVNCPEADGRSPHFPVGVPFVPQRLLLNLLSWATRLRRGVAGRSRDRARPRRGACAVDPELVRDHVSWRLSH
jgi:hypothetical protein